MVVTTIINSIIIIMKIKKIKKEKLEELYRAFPNKVVCKKLGVTNVTLMKYIRLANITPKGSGNRANRGKITFIH